MAVASLPWPRTIVSSLRCEVSSLPAWPRWPGPQRGPARGRCPEKVSHTSTVVSGNVEASKARCKTRSGHSQISRSPLDRGLAMEAQTIKISLLMPMQFSNGLVGPLRQRDQWTFTFSLESNAL